MTSIEDWAERDDNALMTGIADGNEAALRCLMSRYAGSIIAISQRILKNRADAEDVASELFIELWMKRQRFDSSRGNPRAYIFMMTRSRSLDRLRKQAPSPTSAELQELLMDRGATPDQVLFRADRSKIIEQQLGELESTQRKAIELAFFEGLTHDQTAKRLDIPLGTTKTHIRKGLAKLRFLLKGERSHDG